jgi:hypothetical protein
MYSPFLSAPLESARRQFLRGAQWSENSVLAKKFHIYQGGGYFYRKFGLEALFDM